MKLLLREVEKQTPVHTAKLCDKGRERLHTNGVCFGGGAWTAVIKID